MSYGRHAQGKGRHRKPPAPTATKTVLVWVTVMVLIVSLFPVVVGFGLALGVLFGWMMRAMTRN